MYRFLIADDYMDWVQTLSKEIKADPNFEVAAEAYDGKTAIRMIRELLPDVIILDIIMPECDGIYVVNYIRNQMQNYHPYIYMISGIGSDTVIGLLNHLGVDFYSMKPVLLDVVLENLHHMVSRHSNYKGEKERLEEKVREVTFRLGMNPNLMSTQCAVDALVFCFENRNCGRVLTKILYPEIARKHGISSVSVEKNIRNAVEAVKKAKTDLYQEIFCNTNMKITNGHFLSAVSEFI